MIHRMIIGQSGREVDETRPSELLFKASDVSFESIATYLLALHGFASLAEVYNNDGKGASRWADNETALFDTAACDVRLQWSPHATLVPILRNGWPQRIEFISYPASPITPSSPLNLGVTEQLIFNLGQSLLGNFFESQKPLLKTKFGKVSRWPAIWNFGRVVRNAMFHGGAVRIDDRTHVKWRRLDYSAKDNGKRIINTDIWPGDLFIIIKEMEAALLLSDP